MSLSVKVFFPGVTLLDLPENSLSGLFSILAEMQMEPVLPHSVISSLHRKLLQAGGHISLAGLMAKELDKNWNSIDVDLTIRTPFQPIQLVSWLRLHGALQDGKIRIRILDGEILVYHPASQFYINAVDIRNLQPDSADVPLLARELAKDCQEQNMLNRFALLVCNGNDWALMCSLKRPERISSVVGDVLPKPAAPSPGPMYLPYQDPRVDALQQKQDELIGIVSELRAVAISPVVKSEPSSRTPSDANDAPPSGALFHVSLACEILSIMPCLDVSFFPQGWGTQKSSKKRKYSADNSIPNSKLLKLAGYRQTIARLSAQLEEKDKETCILKFKIATLEQEKDGYRCQVSTLSNQLKEITEGTRCRLIISE